MQSDLLPDDLQFTDTIGVYLGETARWGRFLSIAGFIMSGLFVLMAFTLPGLISKGAYQLDTPLGTEFITGMTVNFLVIALLVFLPSMFLVRFSRRMKEALNEASQGALENSFENLKSVFKYYGILTLVVLGIYILALVMSILTMIF